MAGRYDGRIGSSFTEEIVSIPKNYSITHEWCGMSDNSRLAAAWSWLPG
jgi:hypothetical protein